MKFSLAIFIGLISTLSFAQNIVAPSRLLQCDNELNAKTEDVFTYNPKGSDDYYVVTSKTILKKTLSAPSNWSSVKEVTTRIDSDEKQRTIHSSIYKIDANSTGIDKPIYVQTSWSKYDNSPNITRIGLGSIRPDQVGKSSTLDFGVNNAVTPESSSLLISDLQAQLGTRRAEDFPGCRGILHTVTSLPTDEAQVRPAGFGIPTAH